MTELIEAIPTRTQELEINLNNFYKENLFYHFSKSFVLLQNILRLNRCYYFCNHFHPVNMKKIEKL